MVNLVDRTKEAYRRGRRFVTHDVWHVGQPGEEVPKGFLIKHVRVGILLLKNLAEDALLLRASALAFASALAIVPFLALTFFVIETFNLDKELYDYAADALGVANIQAVDGGEPQDEAFNREVAEFFLRIFPAHADDETGAPPDMRNPIEALVEYANRGKNPRNIGLMGVIFIVATVFGLMKNIESSFNQIWGVRTSRSLFRMLSDYLAIVLFIPFFVAGTISVTAVLRHVSLPTTQEVVLRVSQYAVVWFAFTVMYRVVPTAHVKLRYALLGGIVGGTLWIFLTWIYISFQYGLKSYSIFYATFAQFPVLLMWVYFSWAIVLLGAEVSFAYQNENIFALERYAGKASHAYREALGIRIMLDIAARFNAGSPGLVQEEAAREWRVPLSLVGELLDDFQRAGLIVACATEPPSYQPARSIYRIEMTDVVAAIREAGCDPSALRQDASLKPLLGQLNTLPETLSHVTLSDLVAEGNPFRNGNPPGLGE